MSTQNAAVREVVVSGNAAAFAQTIVVGGHVFPADEPRTVGGTDAGPDDLLLAALGACTSMTLGMYARRKRWPLESVRVRLRHSKVHAQDCADCDEKEVLLDRIERDVELTGPLDDAQRARLLEIADRCPVHRTLTSKITIETKLVPGDAT
jgi:putative redox protein